jgi:uncharacterized protein (TIGR02302 family)
MTMPLSRKLRLVRLALLWERAWPPVAAALCLAGLFAALALLGAPERLPFWLHAALAPAFALAAGILLWRAGRVPRPTEFEAARRLERDNGAVHRPLAALADHLAAGDEALWRLHHARMEEAARHLRPGWPDPVLPARDPWGLRFAVLLLLAVALAGSSGTMGRRLAVAANPWSHRPILETETLEVWVVPPAYTGLAQMLLKPEAGPVEIPAGSVARAVTSWRGWGGSALSAGPDSARFGEDGRAELPIRSGPGLDVRLGLRLAAGWPIAIRPDAPPTLAVAEPPKGDERGRLSLELDATDDYGLTRAWVEVRPTDEPAAEPLRLDLVLPGERPRQARLILRADLADHDWAGRRVTLAARAEDGAGQVGEAPPAEAVLPQRNFTHPVARALAEWRRRLSDAPRLGPEVAEELRQLLEEPQAFGGDERVFLALAFTRRLLMRPEFERTEMRSLMWFAATRIEDGGLPAAEKSLDEARSRLERALAGKADPAELSRLVAELEAAMEQWMDALAELGLDETAAPMDGTQAADLGDMLDQLRGLAETGDREGLRRRLEMLSRLLSEMGPARRGQEVDPAAMEAMRRLKELAGRQQELLDRSFRKAPPPGETPFPDEDEDAPRPKGKPSAAERAESRKATEEQKALRQALEALGKSMVQPPDSIAEAQRSMRGAESSLGEGEWGDAAEQQAEAVKRLQDGARQLMERLEAARGKGAPMLLPRDPFGRAMGGTGRADDGRTRVPGRSEIMRAREILQELRRRSGDPARPEPERDYLKRLLKPF